MGNGLFVGRDVHARSVLAGLIDEATGEVRVVRAPAPARTSWWVRGSRRGRCGPPMRPGPPATGWRGRPGRPGIACLVAGAHQVGARILAGAHQIAGGLVGRPRDVDAHQLARPQGAPALGVAAVVLDPIARGSRDPAGGGHHAAAPRLPGPARARPVGPASYAARTGPDSSPSQPTNSCVPCGARTTRTSPVASSISPASTLLARTSRPTKVPLPMPAPPMTVALPPGLLPAATHDHA